MSLSGPGEDGAQVHWDDLGLTRSYDGHAALLQAGRLADLHALSFVDRRPDARTRYVLFHPGLVSTSFSGSYDDAMTAHIGALKRTGKSIASAIEPILAVLDAPPSERLAAFVEGRPLSIEGTLDPQDARRAYDATQRMVNQAVLRRGIDGPIDEGEVDALDESVDSRRPRPTRHAGRLAGT
jgi:hypothetical protein